MCIALRDINKKGVEIGERQNRCHNDIFETPNNFDDNSGQRKYVCNFTGLLPKTIRLNQKM